MGILDGVLGGLVGGELTHLVSNVIEQHGGVAGLVAQFEKQGLGGVAQSWVSNGANQPVSADQVHNALGVDVMSGLAAKFGLNSQDIAQKLAQMLPQVVDQMTPNGRIANG